MEVKNPILSPITMSDYLATQNLQDLTGVWTFRLSPNKWETKMSRPLIRDMLEIWCQQKNQIKKMAAFEEGSDIGQVDRHYHVRIESSWKTRKSVDDSLKLHFGITSSGGRSSAKYSLHDCKKKDKTFWKSKTYIAKQGDCIYKYNHTQAEIAEMIYWGRKLTNFNGKPIAEQIIILYDIKEDELNRQYFEDIYETVQQYFKEIKAKVPTTNQVDYLMHSIMWKSNSQYREVHKQKLIDNLERKYLDLW